MKSRRFPARVLAIILCAVMIASALTGCSGNIKIRYQEGSVPGGILAYYYGYYYLGLYSSMDSAKIAAIALQQVEQYAVTEKLCDDYDITLEPLERKDVLDSIEQEIAGYGGKDEFDAFLKACNLSMKQYREMMYLLARFEKVQTKLFDRENGEMALTDEDVLSYFKENFLHLRSVAVITANCETNAQFTAAKELAEQLYWDLADTGDRDAVCREYADKYPAGKGGAYVSYTDYHTTLAELEPTVANSVGQLEIGDSTDLISTTGGYYIVVREELDEQYAAEHVDRYYKEASNAALQKVLADYSEQIGEVTNPGDLDKIDLDAAVNAWYRLYSNMQSSTTRGSSIMDYFS